MKKMPSLSLRATAFHEAGHAVACIHERVQLSTVSIAPTEDSFGHVGHHNILHGCNIEWEDKPSHRLRMERLVRISLAGPAAQHRFRPRGYRHYHGKADLKSAFELVQFFVGNEEEGSAYLRLLEIQTRNFLNGPGVWDEITALATALLEETTLTPKRTRSIVQAAFQRAFGSHKDKRMKKAKKPQQEK